jgi:hypothetical protein
LKFRTLTTLTTIISALALGGRRTIPKTFIMPCYAVYDKQPWFNELAEKNRKREELAKLKADRIAAQKARAVEEEERLQLARLQEKYGR